LFYNPDLKGEQARKGPARGVGGGSDRAGRAVDGGVRVVALVPFSLPTNQHKKGGLQNGKTDS